MSPYPRLSTEDPQVETAGRVRRPPAPGAGSAGPPLTDLVSDMRRAVAAMEHLAGQARAEARERYVTGAAQGQTDSNGDLALKLFEVPQGATGHLMLCAIDFAGVTPAAPLTSASLWHGIYAGSGGSLTFAQVVTVGSLLDCNPLSPAADAQLPFAYTYGDRYGAPSLVGPQSFYAVIDAATAARQVGVRFGVLIVQPEP